MTVAAIVERFIRDEVLHNGRQSPIDPDESLISSGILDSLSLLKLLVFIEERFDLKVNDTEVVPANFETVGRISALIERKEVGSGSVTDGS